MQKSLFFSGQDVLVNDLTNTETTKEAELLRRLQDLTSTQGVVTGLVVSNGTPGFLSIAIGRAYAANGEVIDVTVTQTDVIVLGAAGVDNGKFVVVSHVNVDGTPAAHATTGALNNTRRTDSFSFAMTLAPTANQVKLVQIVSTAGAPAIATLDATVPANRTVLGARIGLLSVTDDMLRQDGPAPGTTGISKVWRHVYDGFGTGTVTLTNVHGLSPDDIGSVNPTPEHQEFFHNTGIAHESAATAWEVTVDPSTTPDRLLIVAPTASDRAIVNGFTVDDNPALTNSPLLFAAETANFALFEVYLDSTNAVLKQIRSTYSVPITGANVKGVYLIDVSEGHAAGAHNLDFNFVAKTLAWSGGTPVALMASLAPDGRLRLYDADEVQSVDVFVDVSEIYALLANQTDTITVNAAVNRDTFLLLATVPWSGSATGELGFGSWQASGALLDKRTSGNLAEPQIHETFRDVLRRIHRQGSGNGVFRGLQVLESGAPPSLTVVWDGGEAWVDGRHFDIVGSSLLVGSVNPQYVYVDSTGAVVSSDVDPATAYPEIEFALLSRHTTNGVDDITATQDERVLLSQMQGLGEKLLRTATDALVPRTKNRFSIAATVTYTLMSEYRHPTGAEPPFRVYVSTSGNMTMTKNARWDGTNWNADVAAQPSGFYSFGASVIVRRKTAGAVFWPETEWDKTAADGLETRYRSRHHNTGGNAHTLLWESEHWDSATVGQQQIRMRLYVDFVGALVMAFNARWDGTDWHRDAAGFSSTRFRMAEGAISVEVRNSASATPWNDSGWTSGAGRGKLQLTNAALVSLGTGILSNEGNPPASTGISNELRAANIPKAWGRLSIVVGVGSVVEGFNISSVTTPGGNLRVTWAADFSSINYSVSPPVMDSNGGTPVYGFLVDIQTNYAEWAYRRESDDVVVSLAAATGKFMVQAFGKQS